jgi:hypothetical protein
MNDMIKCEIHPNYEGEEAPPRDVSYNKKPYCSCYLIWNRQNWLRDVVAQEERNALRF